jgi:hypothetical protein
MSLLTPRDWLYIQGGGPWEALAFNSARLPAKPTRQLPWINIFAGGGGVTPPPLSRICQVTGPCLPWYHCCTKDHWFIVMIIYLYIYASRIRVRILQVDMSLLMVLVRVNTVSPDLPRLITG